MKRHRPAAPPSYALVLGEQLAMMELGYLLATAPLLWSSPRGDGHTILVLPPLLTDDASTVVLRTFLTGLGYRAEGWFLGRNLWRTQRIVDGLPRRLLELSGRSGRPVSLVGWSAGGMFARDLARQQPEAVRQVITLGSPFRHQDGDGSHIEPIARAFMRWEAQVAIPAGSPVAEEDRPPLLVPATSIYTRGDGLVAWQLCLDAPGPLRENIEVRGTHSGLGHNTAALLAIADRLAQPEGRWAKFRPPLGLRGLYPALVWHVNGDTGRRDDAEVGR